MHYYQFNIGDYIANTARLSDLEDLCYRRLLDLYYLNERPFNECLDSVAREIGFVEKIETVEFILNKYFTLIDGFWHQNRADREISLYQKKLDSASKAGKASAKARQLKASERTLNDRSQSVEPNIKHKPLNNKHTIKTLDQSAIDQSSVDLYFDIFWDSGIRKVNKKKSKSLFVKIINKKTNRNESLKFVDNLVSDIRQRINSNQLGFSEMHPTTYLNGERWNDQITEANTNGQQRQKSFETTSDRYARQSRELQEREATASGNNQNPTLIQTDGQFIRG